MRIGVGGCSSSSVGGVDGVDGVGGVGGVDLDVDVYRCPRIHSLEARTHRGRERGVGEVVVAVPARVAVASASEELGVRGDGARGHVEQPPRGEVLHGREQVRAPARQVARRRAAVLDAEQRRAQQPAGRVLGHGAGAGGEELVIERLGIPRVLVQRATHKEWQERAQLHAPHGRCASVVKEPLDANLGQALCILSQQRKRLDAADNVNLEMEDAFLELAQLDDIVRIPGADGVLLVGRQERVGDKGQLEGASAPLVFCDRLKLLVEQGLSGALKLPGHGQARGEPHPRLEWQLGVAIADGVRRHAVALVGAQGPDARELDGAGERVPCVRARLAEVGGRQRACHVGIGGGVPLALVVGVVGVHRVGHVPLLLERVARSAHEAGVPRSAVDQRVVDRDHEARGELECGDLHRTNLQKGSADRLPGHQPLQRLTGRASQHHCRRRVGVHKGSGQRPELGCGADDAVKDARRPVRARRCALLDGAPRVVAAGGGLGNGDWRAVRPKSLGAS